LQKIGSYVGIDNSEGMLEKAKSSLNKKDQDILRFQIEDAQSTSFSDKTVF
jgi:ubiquinone/menaquinone biosynthesis C-methylase UbiE